MPSSHQDNPPEATAVHILAVPKNGFIVAVFAGPIRGLNMHWVKGSSVPCLPGDQCPTAVHRSGTTWKGYAPVRCWNHSQGVWMPYALEVTEAAEELLHGRDLRGECWRFSRIPRRKKTHGPVTGLLEEVREEQDLIRPFDVVAVILRRYHVAELVWDVPNPSRPQITLAAVSAAPPSSLASHGQERPGRVAKPVAESKPANMRFRFEDHKRALEEEVSRNGDGHAHQ